jgi:hypothetical protein
MTSPPSIVVVDDVYDFDCLNGAPIQPACALSRSWIVHGPDDEPLSTQELQGQLAISVTVQLVTSTPEVPKLLKGICRREIGKSYRDPLCAGGPVLLLERPMLFADLLQPTLSERDLQDR